MGDTPSRAGVDGSYLNTSAYNVRILPGPNQPPPRTKDGANWFGPLLPMTPIAPEGVEGRQWDFPSGYNLVTAPRAYELTTFQTLRALADGWDLLRLVIETRKDQLKRLSWVVQPKKRDQKKKAQVQIDKVTKFLRKPDGFHTFSEWIGSLAEDMFVIDAPTIYKARNRGGDLIALYQIDGATIKPVMDDWGRTPLPYKRGRGMVYPTAYQQVLKGYPAVDYSVRDIIYKPRNVRVNKVYGYSPVEQILATINIALQRQLYTTDYFTQGTVPAAWVNLPDTWTPEQIASFQDYFDTLFSGRSDKKHKVRFLPGGPGSGIHETFEPDLKAEFDDWLSRIVCFAFSISPQALVKAMNRASAQTQKAQAEEEGLVPVMQWIKELVDDLIENELHCPDVEFVFSGEDSTDESAKAVILDGCVKNGVLTINEARMSLGKDPLDDPAADISMTYTAMGYVPIDRNTVEGMKEYLDATGGMPEVNPGNATSGASAPKGTPGRNANTKPKAQDGPGETARKIEEGEELNV